MRVHGSRFAVYGSPLTVHGSALTVHGSPLAVHGSPLAVHGSPLAVHGSPLAVRRAGAAVRRPGVRVGQPWVAAAVLMLSMCGVLLSAQGVFRSGVDGVTVVVTVQKGNQPVGGLTSAEFELRDNGVPQEITSISAEKVPLDLTLLLDLSSSVDGPLLQRLKTAVTETAALLRPDDRIRLVAISQVLREVFSLRPRSAEMALDDMAAEGATSLYDGIASTMMRSAEPGRRQLVVAFTDGRDSTSIIDEDTVKSIARLTDAVVDIVVPVAAPEESASRRLAQRSGSIDSISGGGNVVAGRDVQTQVTAETLPKVLKDLVAPTAGQVIPLNQGDSISRVFRTMLEDFRASYVLRYVAKGVQEEGWHEIAVSVTKRGRYDIRARRGYMGRGRITASEAHGDAHGNAGVVWVRTPLPVRPGRPASAGRPDGASDVQVLDAARRSGRDRPRQGR
jgi:VWFA-related protein